MWSPRGWRPGIEHFVFVVGRGQGAIEDYFDHAYELEAQLEAKGKTEILAAVRETLLEPGQMSFVRQMAPRGLGHAVFCARDIVGDAPFAVMLPDMLMDAAPAALAQAVAAHEAVGGNIVAVEPAPEGEAHKYGIVALGETVAGFDGRLARMTGMVEKPAPGTEPSNLFISGRYILQPEIFALLADQETGAGGEIQLTRRHGAPDDHDRVPRSDIRRNDLRLRRSRGPAARECRLCAEGYEARRSGAGGGGAPVGLKYRHALLQFPAELRYIEMSDISRTYRKVSILFHPHNQNRDHGHRGHRGFAHPRGGRFGHMMHEGMRRGRRHGGEGRLFDQGDLRWVILGLIAEKDSHGYELIKAIEERTGGRL